eukprot:gene19255-21183_t
MEQGNLGIPSSVPAFLVKLWRLVQDEDVDELISWSKNGTAFCIHDPTILSKDILPMYYKHNNFTSFVRQLNMYGFKKVVSSDYGGIKSDKDEWEFHHPNFINGRPDLLEHVKRKVHPEEKKVKSEEFSVIIEDVKELQVKHSNVQDRLESLKLENEDLWREVGDLRLKHKKQQHVLNKLIKFLILVYGGKTPEGVTSRKRLAIGPGQSTSKKMRNRLSDLEEPDNVQYSVESPVNTEDVFTMDLNQATPGPQIVVLPDEPSTSPNIQTISSRISSDVESATTMPQFTVHSPTTAKRRDSNSNRHHRHHHQDKDSTSSVSASSKKKQDELKLELPTMVPYDINREHQKQQQQKQQHYVDFSPSIFEGFSQLFPSDGPLSLATEASQELLKSLPVQDSHSAVVPFGRANSTIDKEDIDFDVDQINGSLESLQNMLSAPQYDIDTQTLRQLFDPSEAAARESKSVSTARHASDEKFQSKEVATSVQHGTQHHDEAEHLTPFSPGMFLNDMAENPTEADAKEEFQDVDSLF